MAIPVRSRGMSRFKAYIEKTVARLPPGESSAGKSAAISSDRYSAYVGQLLPVLPPLCRKELLVYMLAPNRASDLINNFNVPRTKGALTKATIYC